MHLKLSCPKIWIYNHAVDFRKSIDGLCEIVHAQMNKPVQEDVFVFYNTHKNKIKLLAWHGNGFMLFYKRLERGRFTFFSSKEEVNTIDEKQLSWLLAGLDWVAMSGWDQLEYDDFY
jgi:transposase